MHCEPVGKPETFAKHCKEAEEHGLWLIGTGKNRNYRLYKFRNCGHEQEIQVANVRKDKFHCKNCVNKKLREEAEAKGLELIGSGRSKCYRLYRFYGCGHEQEIRTNSVRRNSPRCITCQYEKLHEEANLVGLELIDSGKDNSYRLYRFFDCGHEQEIKVGDVRINTFRCFACQTEKLQKEAEIAGVRLIGDGKDANYRVYKFCDCGHEQEIATSSVRINNFRCRECENSHWDEESHTYVLHMKNGPDEWLKIGYSNRINDRIKQYDLLEGTVTKTVVVFTLDTAFEANQFEKHLQRKFSYGKKCQNEMKAFMQQSGYTECFDTVILEDLLKEIEIADTYIQRDEMEKYYARG